MSYISIGNYQSKIIFPFLSIFLSFIIYVLEYFSSYFFNFKKINSPNLYSLHFSFSFLGIFLFGGICYFILKKNVRDNSNEIQIQQKNDKIKKDEEKLKSTMSIPLIYNQNNINIPIYYLLFSTFLQLIKHFCFCSIVFDFTDIESKILYGGFEIIFIKLMNKYIFKYKLYKHQIISMLILIFVLLTANIFRETFLMGIVRNNYSFYQNDYEIFIRDISNAKVKSGIIYYYYLIFIILGLISKSLSVCFDKWLITDKLCNPYKLLYFKGLFGIIPALSIQLILYFTLGESGNINEEKINIRNLYKRLSFPVSSFTQNKSINISLIICFFILVGFYYLTIIITINKFNSEFIGFVSITSSTLSIITIQFINAIINGNGNNKNIIIFCSIHFLFFILILMPSLIICEIIILHCCNCDKNTTSNIEERANLEVKASLQILGDDDDEDEIVTSLVSSEDPNKSPNF